jgi:hypothetical protein
MVLNTLVGHSLCRPVTSKLMFGAGRLSEMWFFCLGIS